MIEVGIVPHTHWDREWYAPFETFRFRLVRLIDRLLPMLEQDPSYARFLLDGQTSVLDDYLEIRPEAEERLRHLSAAGRVSVGPWMVLMDEFMVSGETIVRDLQGGLRRGADFGGAMPVGYLPDMFGHVAQMPQLLRLAGLEHAVVWRGVPRVIDRTAFWWEAPDGSRVRAEYLRGSYSNGRDIPDDAKALVARARGIRTELGDAHLPGGGMLLMNGTDHQLPQRWLGRVVAEANDLQDDFRFSITSLPEYLAEQPTEDLPRWRGELRSGARANVLMGVASNRVDIHRACAAAERAIERLAEPLAALFGTPDDDLTPFFDEAWSQLVLNSAHDSSCACSADEVVEEVTTRYHQARQIGEVITRQTLRELSIAVDAPPGSTLVVNSTARTRTGLVDGVVPGTGPLHFVAPDGTRCPAQVVGERGGEGFSATVSGSDVGWILDMMRGPEFAGVRIGDYETHPVGEAAGDGDGVNSVEVILHGVRGDEPATDLEELRGELESLALGGTALRLKVIAPSERRIVLSAASVPGFGWRTYQAVEGDGPKTPVGAASTELTNGHLRVAVDPNDGTYAIATADGESVRGLGRLVDGGDGGDTYNYSPPGLDRVIDTPTDVSTSVLEDGPVRARLRIAASYRWPTHAIGDEKRCDARADDTADVTVHTTLELRHDEPFLRVHTEWDNRVRDHRLRAHFPLPAPVTGSDAECAFAVVHRGLEAEGGPQEPALATFVSRRFVDASDGEHGLALLHDGLLEYEVLTDAAGAGTELALTLLRATGYLSRADPSLRPNPAGPLDPLEGPQLQRHLTVDYAVLPHRGDWQAADLHSAADRFLVPLQRVRARGAPGPTRPADGQALAVEGAEVSAVVRAPGGLVLRVYNPRPDASTVRVGREQAPASGWLVDLRGRPLGAFTGELELRAGEIATLQLR